MFETEYEEHDRLMAFRYVMVIQFELDIDDGEPDFDGLEVVGCRVKGDPIIGLKRTAIDDEQRRIIANWWMEDMGHPDRLRPIVEFLKTEFRDEGVEGWTHKESAV